MCVGGGGGGGGGVLNLQPSGRKVCCCGCVLPTSEWLSVPVCLSVEGRHDRVHVKCA